MKYDVIYKPEVHNISQSRQRRSEPLLRLTCTNNLVKIGHVHVLARCWRTDTQTDTHTNEQTQTSQYSAPLLGRRKTRTLHWLPGQQRIDYKVAVLTFKVRSTSTPSYPRRLPQNRQHSHNLRSTTTNLCQPCTTTTLLLPAVWNSLPQLSLIVTLLLCFSSLG